MIEITPETIDAINNSVSTGFQQLLPVFAILLSVILAFFALRKVIFLVTLTKR
jgi:hypothetical protein